MDWPITLWSGHHTQTTDDAGTDIKAQVLPPLALFGRAGPYETAQNHRRPYIPSLVSYCIRAALSDLLYAFKDNLIPYEPPRSSQDYDILRDLMPSFSPSDPFDSSQVDPRLWANIIQVLSHLPSSLRVYTIALADKHLPMLQRVPSTSDFSLLTILDLTKCDHLNDDTVLNLRELHGLCALGASRTSLSAHGVARLAGTLRWCDSQDERDIDEGRANDRRGPWGLRVLWLDGCWRIGHDVFNHLRRFPLLSVVDLRETSCTHNLHSGFASCQNDTLYHPSTLLEAAEELSSLASLTSSPNAYFLHVNSLHYSQPSSQYRSSSSVAREDTYVVLPSTGGQMVHGNTEALIRRQAAVEEEIKYERNLNEWRKRHEKLQDSELWMDLPVKGEPRRMRNEFTQSIVRNAQETKRRLSQMRRIQDRQEPRSRPPANEQRRALPPNVHSAGPSRSVDVPAPVLVANSRSGASPALSSSSSMNPVPTTSRMSNASSGQTVTLIDRTSTSSRPAPSSTSTTNQSGSRTPRILSNTTRSDVPLRSPALSSATTPRSNPTPIPPSRTILPMSASEVLPRSPISDTTMSDLQNLIAAQELSAINSQHKATAFYSSKPTPASASSLPSRYPRGDGNLMLYRQPPPWKLLNEPPPSPAPPQGAAALRRMELPTFVQGANRQAQKNMEGLQNMMAQRLKVAPTASSIRRADGFDDPSRASTTSFQPKNPFTARFSGARGPEPPSSRPPSYSSSKSKRPMSTSVFVPSSPASFDGQPPTKKLAVEPPGVRPSRPSSVGSGSSTSTKPLVPISTISVPDLPEEAKKLHAQNEKNARRSLGSGSKSSKTKTDASRRSSMPTSGSKMGSGSGSSSTTTRAKNAKAASAKTSKSTKSASSSAGGAQQSGSFDWGAWSKPAGD